MPDFVPGVPSTPTPPVAPSTPNTPNPLIPDPNAPVKPPVVPEPTPTPTPTPAPAAPVSLNSTDALDIALETVANAAKVSEADLDRALSKALEFKNAALIDKAFIKEKFGAFAPQFELLAEQAVQSRVQKEQAVQSKLATAAGSDQNWATARDLFNTSADPALKEVVRSLYNAGSDAAFDAATKMVLDHAQSKGVVLNIPQGTRINAGPGAVGLSSDAYQEALGALNKEYRNNLYSPQYAAKYEALVAQRRAGLNAGL